MPVPASPTTDRAPRPARPAVLVVEDDPAVLNLLARVLPPLLPPGVELLPCSTAELALTVLDWYEVRLAISDFVLPRSNGLTLLAEIALRAPAAKRLLITGLAPKKSQTDNSTLIPHAVLIKPFQLLDLRRVVASLLS